MNNEISNLHDSYVYGTPGLADAVRTIATTIRALHADAQQRIAQVRARFGLFEDETRLAQQRSELAPFAGTAQGAQNAAAGADKLAKLLHIIDEARREDAARRLNAEQNGVEQRRMQELMA